MHEASARPITFASFTFMLHSLLLESPAGLSLFSSTFAIKTANHSHRPPSSFNPLWVSIIARTRASTFDSPFSCSVSASVLIIKISAVASPSVSPQASSPRNFW
jgi:hypothetical protein